MKWADLEISLYPTGVAGEYKAGLSFTRSDDEGVSDLGGLQPLVQIDFGKLENLEADAPADYGRALSEALFADPDLLARFSKFRGIAETGKYHLRVRLFLDPSDHKLHALCWEKVTDPEKSDRHLTVNQNCLFSRFLSSQDTQELRLQRPSEINAFVFIANPSDLAKQEPCGRKLRPRKLQPVDAPGELQRARQALGAFRIDHLQPGQRATLDELIAALSSNNGLLNDGISVLYIVCHGALTEDGPYLVLEKEDGTSDYVPGTELVDRLCALRQRPRLVVLASCQSSGTGTTMQDDAEGVLAALGPRLAAAGIPAVLAMQGNVTMDTIADFMPAFFAGLQQHGVIDLALTQARDKVLERPDWWMPVLFTRLKSGRLWSGTETAADTNGFAQWTDLLDSILEGSCVPILGSGFTDAVVGSRREIARKLAVKYPPFAEHDSNDLVRMLQLVQARDRDDIAPRELLRSMCGEMIGRYRDWLSPTLQRAVPGNKEAELIELFGRLEKEVWEKLAQENPFEPHLVLAKLPFTTYLTTNIDGLLSKALEKSGKKPVIDLCRWNEELAKLPAYTADEQVGSDYEPSYEQPLVFHFFGRIEKPAFLGVGNSRIKSAVLTEDDYFDFLLGFGRRNNGDNNTANSRVSNYVPARVRSVMTDSKLLFLGFRMDEWSFRALLRTIKIMEGSEGFFKNSHIAVQIEPEEGGEADVGKAKTYLERYFDVNGIHVDFYPATLREFTRELYQRWFSELPARPHRLAQPSPEGEVAR